MMFWERLYNDLLNVNWIGIIIPVLLSILFWLIGRSWNYIKSIGKKELSGFIGEFYGYYRSSINSKNIIELKVSIYKNVFVIVKVDFFYPDSGIIYKGYVYVKESAIYFKIEGNNNSRFEQLIVFNNPILKSFTVIKGTFAAMSSLHYPAAGIHVLSKNKLSQEQQKQIH